MICRLESRHLSAAGATGDGAEYRSEAGEAYPWNL